MVNIYTLSTHLDVLFDINSFTDYAPNGLQVEGKHEINKIVLGVTACQALLDKAIAAKADTIIVHHGYFWKGEEQRLVDLKYRRLRSLIQNDISLMAYHLPLDVHKELGNNAQLAKVLGVEVSQSVAADGVPDLLWMGDLHTPMDGAAFAVHLNEKLDRVPLHVPGNEPILKSIAWCTGAAQDLITTAVGYGVHGFVTGEVSERTVHIAREFGVHFFAAGHHATERYGVQALGVHLAEKFDVECEFIDVPNPV